MTSISTTLPTREGTIRTGSITLVPVVGEYPVILDLPSVNEEYRPTLRLRIGPFVGAIAQHSPGKWSGSITIHGYGWDVEYVADPPFTLTLKG
jgi:hypothetical protein